MCCNKIRYFEAKVVTWDLSIVFYARPLVALNVPLKTLKINSVPVIATRIAAAHTARRFIHKIRIIQTRRGTHPLMKLSGIADFVLFFWQSIVVLLASLGGRDHFVICYIYRGSVGEQVDYVPGQNAYKPESFIIRNLPHTCRIYHVVFFRKVFIAYSQRSGCLWDTL